MPARVWSTARRTVIAVLCAALVVSHTHANPIEGRSPSLARRQGRVNYTDPNIDGGSMLTILPGNETIGLGEPINVILSGQSDASVLTVEGFLRWVTSINFGVSCLGQANGTAQLANLGDGRGNVTQGTDNGDNGVLRWNYYDPYIGTCRETFEGGNHFRWWKQAETDAYFFAASEELDLAQFHMIALNGYNLGRDWLVGNATFPNGTAWAGNLYNTTVEWVEAGVLLNATSEGINHPSVALPGQPTQDGRVAVLTVRQLRSASDSNGAASGLAAASLALLSCTAVLSAALLL